MDDRCLSCDARIDTTVMPQVYCEHCADKVEKHLRDAKARFAERAKQRLNARAARATNQVRPRYDEVFRVGTDALDKLAGGQ